MNRSPFSGVLHTNAVPNDTECQTIHDLLVTPRKAVADLTQEIIRIQSTLDELTKKREQLNQFIDAHLALVSPARRLPDDIVREIFEASLPAGQSAIMSGAEAPLLVCHISQGWRNLALSTPRLWASIHVVAPRVSSLYEPATGSPKFHQINDAVKAWLTRSGSLSLSISLVVHPASLTRESSEPEFTRLVASSESESSTLINTLIQFSPRWESIRLQLPSTVYFAPLEPLSPSDVPMLRSGSIDGFTNAHDLDDSDDTHSWNTLSFLGTTSLHTVSLRLTSAQHSPLRWERLCHLAIQHSLVGPIAFSTRDALSVLYQCPKLETCILGVNRTEPILDGQPCYMAHLWRLSFMDLRNVGAGFFRNLILPNLRFLEYTGSSSHIQGEPLPFLSLVSSAERLEHLHLRISGLGTDALIDALRLAQTLRGLTIFGEPTFPRNNGGWFQGRDDRLIPLLTPNSTDATVCPRLQSITLLQFSSLSDDALLAFLLARTDQNLEPSSRLSTIQARFSRVQEVDIIPLLQDCIAGGLEVALDYSPPADFPRLPFEVITHIDDWAPISTNWASEPHLIW
ncbi:hypothetical protein C8R44DRAFT_711435 [Mycena epipterygia]|nr:hypothetical protein C8R44DRAFT_711435 [Mycena epipterygia]